MQQQEKHYSAADLAGLPGLPTTERAIQLRAKRESWPSRPRAGRGGGREYPLSALPPATRAHLAAQLASEAAKAGRLEGRKLALVETMTEEARFGRRLEGLKASVSRPANGRLDARLAVLAAWETFRRSAGLAVIPSQHLFADRYNRGEIEVAPWAREFVPDISAATLSRWSGAVKTQGIDALAGRYGNRRGDAKIDRQPALQEFVVSMLVSHPHASSAHVMQAVRARFNGHNALDYPSPRALQRWILAWKHSHKQVFTAVTNPDAWKGKFMAAFGSQSEGIVRLNQRWELDSTPGDVMLTDGRHAVIGVIDVYPRRGKLLVAKTSKATAIATLVRHALLDWGVPETAKTDNGSDYKSHHLTRVFRGLDIDQQLCPPFQPWHKPHIERFFGTFSHDLVELLPGFIGHNVAERQAIEARASFADRLMKRDGVLEVSMTSAEFQKFCDRWCEDIYAHRIHEDLAGKTPFEAVAAWPHPVRRIDDARVLDLLLAEAPGGNGLRTVGKKGIEVDGAWFIAPELGSWVGEKVRVFHDPLDLGRIVVYAPEAEFICIAEAPERTGMDRRAVAIKTRELQKGRVQEERRALKATAKRLKTDDIVAEILAERAEAAGKLVRLPQPMVPYTTQALEAAAEAARAARRPTPQAQPASPELAATLAQVEADLIAPREARIEDLHDDPARYAHWKRLAERVAGGVGLTLAEQEFFAAFGDSPYCRHMRQMEAEFEAYLQKRDA
ncbi:MAG: transposase [Betaproteobacteria bacterium]|nr:transposase [Betaproteobacteria bacterium]